MVGFFVGGEGEEREFVEGEGGRVEGGGWNVGEVGGSGGAGE